MRISIIVGADHGTLASLLEGLVRTNVWLMETNPLPPLYSSGVRYRREPRGSEEWTPAPRVFARRFGDCEDLAAWRAAELRRAGELDARAIPIRSGARIWHAVVEREDGTIEDPSRALGMKGPA